MSTDEVAQASYGSFTLVDVDSIVHTHHPEDFLIVFSSNTTMATLARDHYICCSQFSLSFLPWCKLSHTGSRSFDYCVELELCGISAQAWHLSTAEHILGASCWIEHLHPRTRSRADLAIFRPSGECTTRPSFVAPPCWRSLISVKRIFNF